jgi:hypothetical protein
LSLGHLLADVGDFGAHLSSQKYPETKVCTSDVKWVTKGFLAIELSFGDQPEVNRMPPSLHENPKDDRLGWTGMVGIFVIPVIVVIAVVALLVLDPRAAAQISNAVEAELGIAQVPVPVQPPPSSVIAAVKAK